MRFTSKFRPLVVLTMDFDRSLFEALHGRTGATTRNARYARGFVDAYLDQRYDDGLSPVHNLTVCVPSEDPYRAGWLAGQEARTLHSN